jgi:hypothetical protein
MNLKCLVCLKDAEMLYKGNSLCQTHYLLLEESGRGDSFLEVIIKKYVREENAASVQRMSKASEKRT